MKIKVLPPSKTTKGSFRRMKQFLSIQQKLANGTDPSVVDEMIEVILPFVVEPVDRKQAREALWDANDEQLEEIFKAIKGEPAVPPESGRT